MKNVIKQVGITAGIVGPIFFALVLTCLSAVEYDFMRSLGWDPIRTPTFDWPSGLALGPYGSWMTAAFVICGAGMTLFALALGNTLRRSNLTRLGTGLLMMAGTALAGLSFQTDPTLRATPATWHGRIHDGAYVMLGFSLAAALLTLGAAFLREPRWRAFGRFSWLTAALALPTAILKGVAFYLFLAVVLTWGEVLALHLYQSRVKGRGNQDGVRR